MDKPIYEIPVSPEGGESFNYPPPGSPVPAAPTDYAHAAPPAMPVSKPQPGRTDSWPIFDSMPTATTSGFPEETRPRNVYDIPVVEPVYDIPAAHAAFAPPAPASVPVEAPAPPDRDTRDDELFAALLAETGFAPAPISAIPPMLREQIEEPDPPVVFAFAPPTPESAYPVPAAPPIDLPAPEDLPAPIDLPAPVDLPAPFDLPAPAFSLTGPESESPVVATAAVAEVPEPEVPVAETPVAEAAVEVVAVEMPVAEEAVVEAPVPEAPVETEAPSPSPSDAETELLAALSMPPAPASALRYAPPVPKHSTPTLPFELTAANPATVNIPTAAWDFDGQLGSADPALIAALQDVLMLNASDLHVTANSTPMVRVDGALRVGSSHEVWDTDRVRTALRSIMTPAQEEIFDRDLELDFAYTVSANARFRVNFYQQRDAMGAAFRLIPTEIKQLKDLGIADTVAQFATLPRGLVLVTGPTGSGKSTTLAALVDLVNRTRADHIMTVEDPIEFLHGNHKALVNQREVGHDTHSFAAALKHVLRQDPDVILIGELRDLETISVALTAAETGHLVFATLHTQDAAQTIDRIIDVFPPHQQGQVRSQLAATLQGVVCQTLVKRASGRGRIVATEVLIATPAIANLIREGKTYQISSAMQAGGELGMHTMDRHLADLANSGLITQQAAMDKAQDVEGLKQMIHRAETPSDTAAKAMAASSIDFGDAYSGTAH